MTDMLNNLKLDEIAKLSPPVLLMLFLNLFGFILSKIESFNNKHIPAVLFVFGGVAYPFIGELNPAQRNPHVFLIIIGMIIGGCAVGSNQLVRQYFGEKTSENK